MSKKNYAEKLSVRQRLFCQYVTEGINPSVAAIKAGYSERGNRSRACRLMKRAEIRAEIRRLQKEVASPRIMTLQKRKERLSEIARARMTDYFEVVSGDIRWKIDKEKVPTDGIVKIETVIRTDKYGTTITATSVKLGNTIRAIHELNKMEGLYRQRSKIQPTDLSQERERISQVARDKLRIRISQEIDKLEKEGFEA